MPQLVRITRQKRILCQLFYKWHGPTSRAKYFWDDYDTPDGTCIRDYVYIEDLIAAHILALEYLKMVAKVTSLTWVATTAILLKKC